MFTKALFATTAWLLVLIMAVLPTACTQQPGVGSNPGPAQLSLSNPGPAKVRIFSQKELDQLLAPIALYPDSLLAQILMASTYPLEIVEAERWAKKNDGLKGDDLAAALELQNWDPSVKSLVNFPQVLEMMNERLEWTQKLSDAFLAQREEVMDTVQKLRTRAREQGNLESGAEQKVVVENATDAIIIEPADPEVVYVPTYNPTVVYGTWWYPDYPPYYYHPRYSPGTSLFYFGTGAAVGAAWGYAWGDCDWRRRTIDVDIYRNAYINNRIIRSNYLNRANIGQNGRGRWQHDPVHRRGAPYRDHSLAQHYGRWTATGAKSREAFRGWAAAGRENFARQGASQIRNNSRRGQLDSSALRKPSPPNRGRVYGQIGRGAFSGYESGHRTRNYSNRGHRSISSSRSGFRFHGRGGGHRSGGGGRRR
ncbi:MAG: DUF3300 domain-containing protein [Desulforhopalus sp.]